MADFAIDMQDGVATIVLDGKLDTTNAPALADSLKTLIGQDVKKVVFRADTLDYISSAGLRAIVFAKQKIGAEVEVMVVGAKPDIVDVIKMTGFESFVTIQDSADS